MWLDSGYLLMVELTGFPDGVCGQYDIKGEVKDDSTILGLNNGLELRCLRPDKKLASTIAK